MKLCSTESGDYHLFWRSDLRAFSGPGGAAEFLDTACNQPGFRDLRELVRENPSIGIRPETPVEALVEPVARWLADGVLIATRDPADLYWTVPGLNWMPDRSAAARFLRRLATSPTVLHRLFQFVGQSAAGGASGLLADPLISAVAADIASGWAVVGLRAPTRGGMVDHEEKAGAPKTAPAGAPVRESGPEPDEDTFNPSHDQVAQALALIEAAERGIPFCEECERARLAREQQKGNN